MRRPARIAGPAALAALAALAIAPGAPARKVKPPHAPRGWAGVVATDQDMLATPSLLDSELAVMHRTGVQWLRVPFYWPEAQPYRRDADIPDDQLSRPWVDVGGVPTDWTTFDRIVGTAARRGLRVLPTVLNAPPWAGVRGPGPLAQPMKMSDYARFLTGLVQRYGPKGTFWAENRTIPFRPIRVWQIWNEPMLKYYWKGPWTKGYVAMLKASHAALRKADRGAKLMLAGFVGRSWAHLESIYRRGARGTFQIVALHPYTGRVGNVIRIVRNVRRVMHRHHDDRLPVQITELGWPASRGRFKRTADVTFSVTSRQQANNVANALPTLARVRVGLRITGVYWYTWLSTYRHDRGPWDYAGLRQLREDGSVRATPAYWSFKRTVARLER